VEKDKAIKIGLILIITFGIFFWGFNFLKGKNIFTKTNTYYAYYERVEGLQPNASVILRGHKVGQITKIYFSDTKYEALTVEMSIFKSVEIPEHTIARIISADILGSKSVELILPYIDDYTNLIIIPNKGVLQGDVEGSLQDQVRLQMAPLQKQAEVLLERTSVAIDQIKYVLNESTGEHLMASFEKIQDAVDAIHRSSVTIDTILSKGNKNIQKVLSHVENITKTFSDRSDEIQVIIESVAAITDSVSRANITHTLLMTDSVMTELSILLERVNAGDGTLGALLHDKDLYNNLEASSKNLDKLLLDVKENPKRYVSFPLINVRK
jgi:phospholipid/cholesterol/gamma-HCH transport system substrate-binding protein